jgi:hypothetical protein
MSDIIQYILQTPISGLLSRTLSAPVSRALWPRWGLAKNSRHRTSFLRHWRSRQACFEIAQARFQFACFGSRQVDWMPGAMIVLSEASAPTTSTTWPTLSRLRPAQQQDAHQSHMCMENCNFAAVECAALVLVWLLGRDLAAMLEQPWRVAVICAVASFLKTLMYIH